MINSRKIADLHPKVQEMCKRFIAECMADGIEIIITSTYRDKESQDALYAQGRTAPGRIVTHAHGGWSYHQYRLAFDFAPIQNGKVDWNNTALWKKCGQIAEMVGLEWAGRWKHNTEEAHCHYTGGLKLVELFNGETIA
jgi:peptidoglycan L-alanyl-D-glutamate endopeptidase CwlK